MEAKTTTDSTLKRIENYLRDHAKEGIVDGNTSSHAFWRIISLEDRQRIIEEAGWDSGGWIFKNWRELPHQLQLDIAWAWKRLMDKGLLPDGTPIGKER